MLQKKTFENWKYCYLLRIIWRYYFPIELGDLKQTIGFPKSYNGCWTLKEDK